jgi:hypothetical protein
MRRVLSKGACRDAVKQQSRENINYILSDLRKQLFIYDERR